MWFLYSGLLLRNCSSRGPYWAGTRRSQPLLNIWKDSLNASLGSKTMWRVALLFWQEDEINLIWTCLRHYILKQEHNRFASGRTRSCVSCSCFDSSLTCCSHLHLLLIVLTQCSFGWCHAVCCSVIVSYCTFVRQLTMLRVTTEKDGAKSFGFVNSTDLSTQLWLDLGMISKTTLLVCLYLFSSPTKLFIYIHIYIYIYTFFFQRTPWVSGE